MRARLAISACFLLFSPFLLSGQSQSRAPKLTDTQILGRRIFQQRCAICHTRPTATSPMYGIALSGDLVAGHEDTIRDYIRNGSKRMPGFKYGLQPAEIDAIIDYLKIVPKPQPSSSSKSEGPVD